jgi:hypothetical protein
MEDVKMTDIGEVEDVKSPESMMAVMSSPLAELSSTHSAPPLQSQSGELDGWIEILSKCRQLPEDDVKRLCDKVPLIPCKSPLTYLW